MKSRNNGHTNDWKTLVRRVLLAGVGAVALAQDELETFIDKLVARGEMAEKEGKSLLKDVLQKRREQLKKGSQQLGGAFDNRVERFFSSLHLASKRDVNSLTGRIEELNEKVDALVGRKKGR